jgi:hypothetical protein
MNVRRDDQLATLKASGISAFPEKGSPGFVRATTITDPEGNLVTFVEDLMGSK